MAEDLAAEEEDLGDLEEADLPAVAGLAAVGRRPVKVTSSEFAWPAILVFVFSGNHAPIWVFVLLGAVIAVLALILYFANSIGGGDKDYWYGDPSRKQYLQYPGYGPFGGFTNL